MRRCMGMAFKFREGSIGYLAPRLALAFSQGGSRRMQWNPSSLLPAQTRGQGNSAGPWRWARLSNARALGTQ